MNRSILCDLPQFTTSLASRCERLLYRGVEALVPFVACACCYLPQDLRPRSEERGAGTRGCPLPAQQFRNYYRGCCQRGSPIPKGYWAGRQVQSCMPLLWCRQIHYFSAVIGHCRLSIYFSYIAPHREEGCVPPATTRMEPQAPMLGAFRGIGLTTSTPRFWHAIVMKVSRRREWEITGKPDASRTIFNFKAFRCT